MDAVGACRPSSTDRNSRTSSSVAAGLSGSRAIGSLCSGCTPDRWQSRASSPSAYYHRLWPAGYGARSRPFLIGQVARIAQVTAVVAGTVCGRPHRRRLPQNQAAFLESQTIHPIQYVPGQTLRFFLCGCERARPHNFPRLALPIQSSAYTVPLATSSNLIFWKVISISSTSIKSGPLKSRER